MHLGGNNLTIKKIYKENVYQFLLQEIPEFKDYFLDEFDEDDEIYYIIGLAASRFNELQLLEISLTLTENEINELQNYYNFINNTISLSNDKYVEELIAYGFFENLNNIDNYNDILLKKLNDKAKILFQDVEEFWKKMEGQ